MSRSQAPAPAGFPTFLKEVKARIQQAQTWAVLPANAQLVRLSWDIGRMIDERHQQQGWGAAVVPRLARELRNELPEIKGFSERNIDRMAAFYRVYPAPSDFSPPSVAKLSSPTKVPQAVAQIAAADQSILSSIPFGYQAWLMDKVDAEHWYMNRNAVNGWSRNVPVHVVQLEAPLRQGSLPERLQFRRNATSYGRLPTPPAAMSTGRKSLCLTKSAAGWTRRRSARRFSP